MINRKMIKINFAVISGAKRGAIKINFTVIEAHIKGI